MTNNVNEALAVTQTDRDAAADFYSKYLARPGEVPVEAAFRFGQVDESPLIQAFALHRIASAKVDDRPLREAMPDDVVRLVVAARSAWEAMDDRMTGAEDEQQELDKALEAFASRVCYDDEGGSLPEAHANPCTCAMAALAQSGRGGE